MTESVKKPLCVLDVDVTQVNEAIIAQAAKQIGSTAMNTSNCTVTLKKGRKTDKNPNPSTFYEVAFFPELSEQAPNEDASSVSPAAVEAPAEEVAEAAPTGDLFN